MLTALDNGVKGGRWFSLIDKGYHPANLHAAFAKVKANGGASGVDHQTVEAFETNLEDNLERLAESLRAGTYRPSGIRRVWTPKPGQTEKRPLGIPTVRDRVAQGALRAVLEPIFERDFAEHSYGFRPGRGCKDALRRVDGLLRAGHTWIVDADLKSYFDTIPHGKLMERVEAKVADGRVLALIGQYLKAQVMETAEGWTPQEGCPQGAVIRPLLSNIYLDDLDQTMAQGGCEMIRHADDFVILCRSESAAREALSRVAAWTAQAGLTLHPAKTRIVDATRPGGFDFLGYHFEPGYRDGKFKPDYRWPSGKSLGKLQDSIRSKTHRANGHSLEQIIGDVNRTVRGWFGYFQHSYVTTFRRLDGWIRGRLRAVLRKRSKRQGRARGDDHHRWPNAFFDEHGLYSLVAAHASLRQSLRG
jgi:RNA-directed DNA polymerase